MPLEWCSNVSCWLLADSLWACLERLLYPRKQTSGKADRARARPGRPAAASHKLTHGLAYDLAAFDPRRLVVDARLAHRGAQGRLVTRESLVD